MRRRVGVGHVLQERQRQQTMADFGAQITAERVGQIADQLEDLQQQLRQLAERHKAEIKENPVVRARFRQLGDSLGVDVISSKTNVFAKSLGLGDFYYQLAARVVDACMAERHFCGAYVPLKRVHFFVQKAYDTSTVGAQRTDIAESDILAALSKLSVLGDGYNVVKLGGVAYIQTMPDSTGRGDHVLLLNYILELQQKQISQAKEAAVASKTATTVASSSSAASGSRVGAQRTGVGASYALGAHPFAVNNEDGSDAAIDISFAQQCVAVRESAIVSGLNWEAHRARAALGRMVQQGTAWVEEPELPVAKSNTTAKGKANAAQTKPLFSASEAKEVWRVNKKGASEEVDHNNTVYWFVSLTSQA